MGKKIEACEAPAESSSVRDSASTKCSNEAFDQMRGNAGKKPDDLYRFDGSNAGGKFPPPLEIRDGSQERQSNDAAAAGGQNSMATLFDKSASPEAKLASARQLYDSGTRSITLTDKDGNEHKLRFEKLPVGDTGREMVHVFGTDQSGKERTVLRGIADNGGFKQERDAQGNFVDYYGRGKDLLDMTGASQNHQPQPDICPEPNNDQRRPNPDPYGNQNYGRPDAGPYQRDPRYDGPDADPNRRDVCPDGDPYRRDPRDDQSNPYRRPPDYNPYLNPNPYRRDPDCDPVRPDLNPGIQETGSRRALEPVTDPAILCDVGRRPDGSAVQPTYIGIDNTASYLGSDGRKHIQPGLAAWMDKPAAEAFVAMNEKLARVGKRIQIASDDSHDGAINSAGRTHTQQKIATGLHAKPGNSVHEQGRGLDVRNYQDPDVRAALREYGFVQGNLSRPNVPIRGDAWHFSFAGRRR